MLRFFVFLYCYPVVDEEPAAQKACNKHFCIRFSRIIISNARCSGRTSFLRKIRLSGKSALSSCGATSIWVVFPRTGKMSKICHNFFSLELYCDQTVLYFQVFSIVLKSLCPLESKTTFVLVLAFFFYLKKIFFGPKSNLLVTFTVSLTLSCDQTFRDGLDLTCS